MSGKNLVVLCELLAAVFIFNAATMAQVIGKPLVLPTRYDAHRFYAQPTTVDGVKLNFFTDTGGGLFLFADTIERLKIETAQIEGDGGEKMDVVGLPPFKNESSIPAPLGSPGGKLFVTSVTQRLRLAKDWSGMLGQQWFAGRVWTFDYLGQKLLLRANGDTPKVKDKHRVALGFKTSPSGKRQTNFPRISVIVDGETLDLLFDTGATTELTETALVAVKDKLASVRATSFIAASIFQKWREKHPDWRVLEAAENGSGEAMIEVPKITVGGYTVGAVWFTRRADKNFHEFMTRLMDRQVEGALGGNALHHFRITLDYPNAAAFFEK